MKERHQEELDRLKDKLGEVKRQRETDEAKVEQIRSRLEEAARRTLAEYQEETDASYPEAQKVINQVVKPFFSELSSSEAFVDLVKLFTTDLKKVRLSAPIIHHWPREIIRGLAKEREKPFQVKAKILFERHQGEDLKQAIEDFAASKENWYGGFEVCGLVEGKLGTVEIWREPARGVGFGFAMAAGSYKFSFEATRPEDALKKINPSVWIEFGKQVNSGQVWQAINDSI